MRRISLWVLAAAAFNTFFLPAEKVWAQPDVPAGAILQDPNAIQDKDWHWIRVEPTDNHAPVTWNVSQGIAKNVEFAGRNFSADLYDMDLKKYPGAGPAIRLKGSIANGKITAHDIYIGTDARPEPFHGTIRKLHLTGNGETDRIILSGEWANAFIGITRLAKSN